MSMATQLLEQALGITTKEVRPTRVEADATRLPGSPPIGVGRTVDEAKYDLLARLHINVGLSTIRNGYGGTLSRLITEAADVD